MCEGFRVGLYFTLFLFLGITPHLPTQSQSKFCPDGDANLKYDSQFTRMHSEPRGQLLTNTRESSRKFGV